MHLASSTKLHWHCPIKGGLNVVFVLKCRAFNRNSGNPGPRQSKALKLRLQLSYWFKSLLNTTTRLLFLHRRIRLTCLMCGGHKSSGSGYTMLQNPNEGLSAICCNIEQRFFVTLFLSTGNNLGYIL